MSSQLTFIENGGVHGSSAICEKGFSVKQYNGQILMIDVEMDRCDIAVNDDFNKVGIARKRANV